MRLKVTSTLRSRDGTLARGSNMKNVIAEVVRDRFKIIKRPGGALLLQTPVVTGQGLAELNGFLYMVSGDTLRKVSVSPASVVTTFSL